MLSLIYQTNKKPLVMTKQELINNAIAKKFTIEFSEDQFGNEMIGINKGKWNYHWFKVYTSGNVFFHHTYSQINGKTKKGLLYGIRVQISLENN